MVCRTWRGHIKAAKSENQMELYQMLGLVEEELYLAASCQFAIHWSAIKPEFVKVFKHETAVLKGLHWYGQTSISEFA